jgi:hypothetical protein
VFASKKNWKKTATIALHFIVVAGAPFTAIE